MRNRKTFRCLVPKQSDGTQTFVFCTDAKTVLAMADIDRAGRTAGGELKGFQRPQVAGHIAEIRNYLADDGAVLPNSVVLAFTKGVRLLEDGEGQGRVQIDLEDGNKGFVVDGQQRLTALAGLEDKSFQVIVSAMVCKDEEELRKQFILINNTKPLPKTLIYELLPSVSGLPDRLGKRSTAAAMIERLNYDEQSSLRGQILQHTNPTGVLRDTALQKLVMNSLSDGALREIDGDDASHQRGFELVSGFFQAVQRVFEEDWRDRTPRTSRLLHGSGLIAMGYVMEYLYASNGATTAGQFQSALEVLKGHTAWSSGEWHFGDNNIRPWDGIQNVSRDWMELAHFLVGTLKKLDREAA